MSGCINVCSCEWMYLSMFVCVYGRQHGSGLRGEALSPLAGAKGLAGIPYHTGKHKRFMVKLLAVIIIITTSINKNLLLP